MISDNIKYIIAFLLLIVKSKACSTLSKFCYISRSKSGAGLWSLKLSRLFRLDLSSAFEQDRSIGQMVFSFHLDVAQTW